MSMLRNTLILIGCALFVSGCFEDEAVVTLNTDGSGTFSQTLKLSERLLVAVSDGGQNQNAPPATKEALRDQIGSALTITTLHETNLPDGGRIVAIEGTFDSAAQFFLSDFCRNTLKLRLTPAGEGKAALHSEAAFGGDSDQGPTVTQLYGLAKDMYVSRTIHLPVNIERTNGQLSETGTSVCWTMDLRNPEALAKTKAFIEGPDRGKGIAVFDTEALTFTFPLQQEIAPEPAVKEITADTVASPDADLYKADVAGVSCNKTRTADGTLKMSDLQLILDLQWDEKTSPVRCGSVVLLTARDDLGKDVAAKPLSLTYLLDISDQNRRQKTKEVKLPLTLSSDNARKISSITGYIEVVAEIQTEEIILEDLDGLVGAEAIGSETLDRLNFKILSIKDNSIQIEIDGGHTTITAFEPLREDGSASRFQSRSGWERKHHYTFADDFSDISKCRIEVVVAEQTVKVPFSLEEILLP